MLYKWDPKKAKSNANKHRITFDEAVTVFADPMGLLLDDLEHGEGRYVLIGMSRNQRVLYVVHLETAATGTRIISARKATSHERRRYEEGE